MRRITFSPVGNGSTMGTLDVQSNIISTLTANEDLVLDANGTGTVQVDTELVIRNRGDLRLLETTSNGTNYIAMHAAAAMAANYTITWPDAVATTTGFALTSDTSGNLSWAETRPALTDNNSDTATNYISFTTNTTSFLTSTRVATTTRPLTYQPSTGTLTTTVLSATTLTETSSIALKENIIPIDNALDKILSLNAYIYDRRDGSKKGEAGLIAEEVYKIIPNVIQQDDNGNPVSIAYQRLTAYLIESIKELKNEIDSLKGAV